MRVIWLTIPSQQPNPQAMERYGLIAIRPRQVFRVTQLKHVSNPSWAGFWAQGGCSELGSGLLYRTQLGYPKPSWVDKPDKHSRLCDTH